MTTLTRTNPRTSENHSCVYILASIGGDSADDSGGDGHDDSDDDDGSRDYCSVAADSFFVSAPRRTIRPSGAGLNRYES